MKMVSFGNELYFRSCVRLTIIIISITISSYVSTRDTLPEVEHYAADWEYEDFNIGNIKCFFFGFQPFHIF